MDEIKRVKKRQSFTVKREQLDTGDLADSADINDIIEINFAEV